MVIKSVVREAILFAACAVFTGTVGLIILDLVIMPRIVRKGQQVEVPDIVELAPDQARNKLRRRGLRLKLLEPRWDASVIEGKLVYQNPAAFSHVKTNRTVYAIPSRGSRLYEVPDLRKKSLRQARLWIEHSGLEVGEVVEEASPIIKEGLVMLQSPDPGTRVPVGAVVVLTVSNGPPGETVVVPNLVGKRLETARVDLKNLGLRVRDIRFEFSTQHMLNMVIEQIPEAGEEVRYGTAVRLVVSQL
jgi:serine/threonine-protein kinase